MNTQQGFYKYDAGLGAMFAPNFIEGDGYILLASEKDNYTYPVDGWYWCNTKEEAMILFGGMSQTTDSNPITYYVQPENIYLATSRADEGEFTKMITLLQLALQSNQIALSSPISIKDVTNTPKLLTVGRFLEVMLGYGFFCYSLRNL
jgi:hypothetical protein